MQEETEAVAVSVAAKVDETIAEEPEEEDAPVPDAVAAEVCYILLAAKNAKLKLLSYLPGMKLVQLRIKLVHTELHISYKMLRTQRMHAIVFLSCYNPFLTRVVSKSRVISPCYRSMLSTINSFPASPLPSVCLRLDFVAFALLSPSSFVLLQLSSSPLPMYVCICDRS